MKQDQPPFTGYMVCVKGLHTELIWIGNALILLSLESQWTSLETVKLVTPKQLFIHHFHCIVFIICVLILLIVFFPPVFDFTVKRQDDAWVQKRLCAAQGKILGIMTIPFLTAFID